MKAIDEAMKWASENPTILERLAPSPAPHRLVLDEIARERERQMGAENWTPEHDDTHRCGELAMAAAAYAYGGGIDPVYVRPPLQWPWSKSWWKPSEPRQGLVKAAALIIAEIERLDRAEAAANRAADAVS